MCIRDRDVSYHPLVNYHFGLPLSFLLHTANRNLGRNTVKMLRPLFILYIHNNWQYHWFSLGTLPDEFIHGIADYQLDLAPVSIALMLSLIHI